MDSSVTAVTAVTASKPKPKAKTWRRPPWLPDGPLTERVRLVACNRCGRPVLEALADRLITTHVDPLLLTPQQELALYATHPNARTYCLAPDPRSLTAQWITERRLLTRDIHHLRAHPGRGLPAHDCAVQHGRPDLSLLWHPTSSPKEPPF